VQEISHFGVDLKSLLHNQRKLLLLSEYGLGGGTSNNGSTPAVTAAEAAATPFFGVFGAYNRTTDPWVTWAPEATLVETRAFRRHFFVQTSRCGVRAGCWLRAWSEARLLAAAMYLSLLARPLRRWMMAGGSLSYPVHALFLWSMSSWDVQGEPATHWLVPQEIHRCALTQVVLAVTCLHYPRQ
jgi:hypothetical protein